MYPSILFDIIEGIINVGDIVHFDIPLFRLILSYVG